jgi:multidrug efflux system membrane fusion protein
MSTPTYRLAAAVALAALAACAHEERYEKPKTPVNVQQVAPAASVASSRYSAAILPGHRVDVAFKVPGYIASLGTSSSGRVLQEGDAVHKGDVLARIRTDDYTAKIDQARSQQAEADAAYAQARQAWERAQALFEKKSLTRPDYEAAKAAFETVQAKQAGARALVAEAQNALADSVLRSPLDGVVVKRLVEAGSLVGPGTPGYVIVDSSSVKLLFGVPDTMLRRLTRGTEVSIATESYPNARFPGVVSSVAPAADPGSLVFDIEVTVANRDGRLKPGMVGTLDVAAEPGTPAITVPLAGIVRSKTHPDGYAVYVVEDRDGGPHVRLRDVSLGAMTGNGITVLAGLRPGDRVVVTGATIVNDGEAVEILQ